MVEGWWKATGEKFPGITPQWHVIMPNHLHGVVVISDCKRMPASRDTPGASLSTIMQWFKTMTTNAYIRGVKTEGWSLFQGHLWQRNYYEHVIRDDVELERVCAYIDRNPAKWQEDEENPTIPS